MILKFLLATFLCSSCLCSAKSSVECKRALDVERLLGLDERDIDSNTCDLSPVIKPIQGPRGARAKWTLAGASVAGLPLTTTLFVAQGRVRRIEQVWESTERDCASIPSLNLVTNALKARFGAPLAANLSTRQGTYEASHAWVSNDTVIASYEQRASAACVVRLVLQRQQIKDATEL